MKSKRHALILQIIADSDIVTQEELARALEENGVKVTQATVSRDIKELRLIKVQSADGGYKYAVADQNDPATQPQPEEKSARERYMQFFLDSVRSITPAGNLIVLKTGTAAAQTVAEFVDNLAWPEIAGTIAGENTVLVIIKDLEDVDDVLAKLSAMTGRKGPDA